MYISKTYTERINLRRLKEKKKKTPTQRKKQTRPEKLHGHTDIVEETLMIKYTTRAILWINVALPQIYMVIINISCPIVSILGYAYLQPWFHVAIIVYHSCSFDFLLIDIRVVTKA